MGSPQNPNGRPRTWWPEDQVATVLRVARALRVLRLPSKEAACDLIDVSIQSSESNEPKVWQGLGFRVTSLRIPFDWWPGVRRLVFGAKIILPPLKVA